MKYNFYVNGTAWCDGKEEILEDHLVGEGPEGVALWRLSLDLNTKKVVVKYEGLSDSEAEKQLDLDLQAQHEANIAKDAEKRAASEAAALKVA